jgi:hypothetical protein
MADKYSWLVILNAVKNLTQSWAQDPSLRSG